MAAWVATDHSPISQRMPRRACAGVEAASSRADAATHVHEARPGQSAHGAILASTAKSALSRLVCASQPRRHRQLTQRFPLPSLSMFPRSFPDLRPRRSPRRSLFVVYSPIPRFPARRAAGCTSWLGVCLCTEETREPSETQAAFETGGRRGEAAGTTACMRYRASRRESDPPVRGASGSGRRVPACWQVWERQRLSAA